MLCVLTVDKGTTMIKKYSELKKLKTFEERYEYLRIAGLVGESTFGFDRILNQILYRSGRWKSTRNGIIIRDKGCDLGIEDREINDRIYIHHIDPITIEDVEVDSYKIYNPENLICTSFNTHQAIHYGNKSMLIQLPIERTRNDTCPWKK